MFKIVFLFLLSAIPVIVMAGIIYKKDKNKEPMHLLFKLFLGGILSVFITLAISLILQVIFPFFALDTEKLNKIELIFSVFIGIALVEEFSKWFMLYLFSYNEDEFDEFYDMMVYGAFTALGFAFIENIFYVFQNGADIGLLRAFLAVPGHAFFGVFMGYYLGLAKISLTNKNKSLEKKNILFSLIIPTFLHGVYDYCLMTSNILFIVVFLIFIILLYIFSFKKINLVSNIPGKIKYTNKYCPNCGTKVESNYCPTCGHKNE